MFITYHYVRYNASDFTYYKNETVNNFFKAYYVRLELG